MPNNLLICDTNHLRLFSQQAELAQTEVNDRAQNLRAISESIDWSSPAQEMWMSDLYTIVLQLEQRAEELQDQANRLAQEADAWDQVGVHFAGFTTGLPEAGGFSYDLSKYAPVLIPVIGAPIVLIIGMLPFLPDWVKDLVNRPSDGTPVAPPPGWQEDPRPPGKVPNTPSETLPEETVNPPAAPVELPTTSESSQAGPPYNVPIKNQSGLTVNGHPTGYGCTPTSASMVMEYWHSQDEKNPVLSPQEIIDLNKEQTDTAYPNENQFKRVGGMGLDDLEDDLERSGYEVNIYTGKEGEPEEQTRLLKESLNSGPVLVNARTGMGETGIAHTVVVTGISADGTVQINDPLTGEATEYSWEAFDKSWGSDFGKSKSGKDFPTRIFATIKPPSKNTGVP